MPIRHLRDVNTGKIRVPRHIEQRISAEIGEVVAIRTDEDLSRVIIAILRAGIRNKLRDLVEAHQVHTEDK